MTSNLIDQPRDLTVAEASSILNCTNPTIYNMLKQGKLDSYLIGRGRRITYESIQRLRSGGKAGAA